MWFSRYFTVSTLLQKVYIRKWVFVCSLFVFFFNMFNVHCSTFNGYSCRIAFECHFCRMEFSFFSLPFSLSHFLALHVRISCINRFQCSLFSSTFHSFSTFCFNSQCVSLHCTRHVTVWHGSRRLLLTGYKYVYVITDLLNQNKAI